MARLFDARIDGQGQVAPMHQVVANCVAPVLARVFRGMGLIEQVVPPLPETQPVRVVQESFRMDEVKDGSVGVAGQSMTRLGESKHYLVRTQLV